jgi:hypothetical protein
MYGLRISPPATGLFYRKGMSLMLTLQEELSRATHRLIEALEAYGSARQVDRALDTEWSGQISTVLRATTVDPLDLCRLQALESARMDLDGRRQRGGTCLASAQRDVTNAQRTLLQVARRAAAASPGLTYPELGQAEVPA